jgi:hypothetical protein
MAVVGLLATGTRALAVQASGALQVIPDNWGLLAVNDEVDVTIIARNTSTDTPAASFPDGLGDVPATLEGNVAVTLACTDPTCSAQVAGKMVFLPVGGNGCVAKHPAVTSCTSGGGQLVNVALGGPIALPAGGSVDVATIRIKMIDVGGVAQLGIRAQTEPASLTACSTNAPAVCAMCMAEGCTKVFTIQGVNTGPCPHACPSKIRFLGDAAKPDFFEFHSLIFPGTVIDPPTQAFTITLSNALFNPIFSFTLPPGSFTNQGDAYTYADPGAATTGGIAWVKMARRDGFTNVYRVDIQAYDATLEAKALLASMTVEFSVGPETFSVTTPWTQKVFGWQLNNVP